MGTIVSVTSLSASLLGPPCNLKHPALQQLCPFLVGGFTTQHEHPRWTAIQRKHRKCETPGRPPQPSAQGSDYSTCAKGAELYMEEADEETLRIYARTAG